MDDIERRASFDIGSGSTKMQVSDVKHNQIIKTYFGQERPVGFGFDFMGSKDGNLSLEIQEKGIQTFKDLKLKAEECGATKFAAVATEVFRKAKNGSQYLDQIRALGIQVMLVSQDVEAEIGFASAIAMSSNNNHSSCKINMDGNNSGDHNDNDTKDIGKCVWDSGGASFQITHRNTLSSSSSSSSSSASSQSISTYMGAIGTSVSLSIFLQNIRGIDMQQNNNINNFKVNPVSKFECDQFINVIRSKLSNDIPSWLRNRKNVIAAAGSNSLFKLCCIIFEIIENPSTNTSDPTTTTANTSTTTNNNTIDTTNNTITNTSINNSNNYNITKNDDDTINTPVTYFTLSQAENVLFHCLDRTDQELLKFQQFLYAEGTYLIIPKLALLIAVMRHTGIQSIHSVDCIGSCAGVLCDDRFWLSSHIDIISSSP